MIIKYNAANIFQASDKVKLLPGVNANIAAKDWDACVDHPIVKILIDEGKIEVLASKDDTDAVDLLKGHTPAKAIELVKATVDKAVLEKMLAAETRKAVKDVIQKQLKDLADIEFRDKKSPEKDEAKK